MRILLLTALFVAGTVGSAISNAFAEIYFPRHSWEAGTEMSYIKYEEPDVMEEEGMMYGVAGSYTYRGWISPAPIEHDRYMAKVEGKASWGEVDYSSEDSGTMDDIDDYTLEFRGLFGYDFPIFISLTETVLTPYIGFGYRYLNDDLNGTTSTGSLGYERESNYYYSPIGIESITELNYEWSLGLSLEYDLFWKGIQKSHLSDARCYDSVAGYYRDNDIENDQDKGYGIRGSVKFQKKTEKLDLIIAPYIKYWNIKKSDEVTTSTISENGLWTITTSWVEPKNNSTEIGGKFAVRF